jgi:hypothetical protein
MARSDAADNAEIMVLRHPWCGWLGDRRVGELLRGPFASVGRPSAAHTRRPASPGAALIATCRSPTRAADQLREPQGPLRHQFRMFDVVGT